MQTPIATHAASRVQRFPGQSKLKEGDRVAYKFREDAFQSTAEVIRVRENKEKTDAGETVTTIHYDVMECDTGERSANGRHDGEKHSAVSHVWPQTIA